MCSASALVEVLMDSLTDKNDKLGWGRGVVPYGPEHNGVYTPYLATHALACPPRTLAEARSSSAK